MPLLKSLNELSYVILNFQFSKDLKDFLCLVKFGNVKDIFIVFILLSQLGSQDIVLPTRLLFIAALSVPLSYEVKHVSVMILCADMQEIILLLVFHKQVILIHQDLFLHIK